MSFETARLAIDAGSKRRPDEHAGTIESLWGRIDPSEMGIRAGREPAPIKAQRRPPLPHAPSRDTRSATDYITAVVAGAMDEQPSDVIHAAVEDIVALFKNQELTEQAKREQLNSLLQTPIDDDRFIQLVNLANKLPSATGGRASAKDVTSGTLAIEFDDDDNNDNEDDALIGALDDIEEEEEDEQPVLIEDPLDGIHGRKGVNLDALAFPLGSHTMTNRSCALPEETTRHSMPGYEEIHVPAARPFECAEDELLPVSKLPEHMQAAFAGIPSLNYIQSRVAGAVLDTTDNILLCAPTGSGKTNVALLAILNEVHRFADRLDSLKVVYIAPMKALVQEMVRTLATRLAPYHVTVAELTGDSQSTRAELGQANVIVATPEKWDVVSRKANDLSYVRLVRLVIVDEIHLLHDERGPVLEAIVMRLLLDQQRRSEHLRIVGLSATLPNYIDVARFIRSTPACTFMFDIRHRPVPLAQTFVGITDKRPLKRVHVMNDVCYRMVAQRAGHSQTLVFVHSRKDTFKTAKMIADRAVEDGVVGRLVAGDGNSSGFEEEDVQSLQSADLKQVIKYGVAIHHAGLVRNDRLLVERWFAEGRVQVLVSTATLAWGVNLPAHTVIIKGTQVYRPECGAWCELSGQDVLQMLGRAGRPQYDTQGEGIIITEHSELPFYMSLSTMQLPIESQMIGKLPDHLNAAIAYGLVDSLEGACDWLRASYLHVRMQASPLNYGVTGERSVGEGVEDVCHAALLQLKRARLIDYDTRSYRLAATDLGRIASDYYLPTASAAVYDQHLCRPSLNDIDLCRIFSLSHEFKSMAVRREEQFEIAKLTERVPIPVRESADDPLAKVNVLLQACISQLSLAGFALQADTLYVTQNAARLFRAMLAVSLSKGFGRLSRLLLSLCKSVDRRQWYVLSPLRQISSLSMDTLNRLERKALPFDRFFDLNPEELGDLVRQPAMGPVIHQALQQCPRVQLQASVVPLSPDQLELTVSVEPKWTLTGAASELFWVLIEDPNSCPELVATDSILFTERSNGRTSVKKIRCRRSPSSPVLFINVVSDRWFGAEARLPVALMDMAVPAAPLPLLGLQDRSPVVVGGQRLSAMLSNAFDAIEAVNAGGSAFVAIPADPLPLLAALDGQKIVHLHPKPEYVAHVLSRHHQGAAARLSGDPSIDCALLDQSDSILLYGTVKEFETLTRRWKSKRALHSIDLIVVQDAHLMHSDPTVDICLSRIRYIRTQLPGLRLMVFSQPVANGFDLGQWLVGPSSLVLPFDSTVRPCSIAVQSMPQTHLPSLILAATRLVSQVAPSGVVVFVDGYRQARQTCLDLAVLGGHGGDPSAHCTSFSDRVLQEAVAGRVAYLHESLPEAEQEVLVDLFVQGRLSHLVLARESVWSFSPSQLQGKHVCVLGTSAFDPSKNALLEYDDCSVQRMLLFAEQATIFCCHSVAGRYKRVAPTTVESPIDSLSFPDHLNSAIASRAVSSQQDAVDLLTWTFMYHRLVSNPNYYGLDLATTASGDHHPSLAISAFLSELVEDAVQSLVETRCVALDGDSLRPSNYGLIASHYGVHVLTVDLFAMSAKRSTRHRGLLELVSAAVEFDHSVVVRHGERRPLSALADTVPHQLPAGKPLDDPFAKVNLLLQAHLARIPLPLALQHDQAWVVVQAQRLVCALFDVLSSQSWLNACCAAAELSQMLVQGLWKHDHPLLSIPFVTEDMVDAARHAGIHNVYGFVDHEDEEWKRTWVAMLADRGQQRAAIQAINRYPSLQVDAKRDADTGAVRVTIERDVETDPVVAPLFKARKEEQWWVVLAEQDDTLVAVKKTALREEKNVVEFGAGDGQRVLLTGYRIDKEIGRGAFATVYLARVEASNAPVAIKAVRTSLLTRKLASALASEIAILRSIRDPHIVRLDSLERRQEGLFLVMEWCEGGDLAQYLRSKGGRLEEQEASRFVGQLAAALGTLRRANLVHRDIKPQNLLLSSDCRTLKLADFGFARYVEEDNLAETLCGSPLYMAPEILRYERYDERADLWSVGAVLYEMLFGRPPFRAQNHIQLLKVIEEAGGVVSIPLPVSGAARSLLLGLLQADPGRRLDYAAFLAHPFLTSHGAEADDAGLFECRPIPIKRAPSLPSPSASSSTPASSLLTTAYSSARMRKRGVSVPPSTPAAGSMFDSIRERIECEDDHLIASLPTDCQVSVQKGLVLSALIGRSDNPLLAMQSLRHLVLGVKGLGQQHPHYRWLLDRTRKVGEQVDFGWSGGGQAGGEGGGEMATSLLLYDHSLRVAMEGGFQELLGRLDLARAHYRRSLFILTHFSPVPLHGQAIQDYRRLVEQRLAVCTKKLGGS